MMDWDDPIAAENAAVLMVVDAMFGEIRADWDAITMRIDDRKLVLRVWVDDVEAAVKDLEQLVGDLQTRLVGQGGEASLELCTSLAPSEMRRSDSYRQHGRLVYLRSFKNWGVRMTPENYAVLVVVAAMWGEITPDFDAITVQVEGPKMMLRVWVDDAEAAVEATDTLAFELEALTIGEGFLVYLEVVEGTLPYDRERHGRLVYMRRRPPAAPEDNWPKDARPEG